MSRNPLIAVGRAVWSRYNSYLPASLQQRILAARRTYDSRSIERVVDTFGLEIDNPEALDTNARAALQRDRRERSDGMADYPVTRPHLAFDFLSGLVRWLADSDYKVLSYHDLAWPMRYGEEADEFRRWTEQAAQRGEKGVLLQYDVDARPDLTAALMKTHIACGVPGNAMIFKEKIFDWKLKREGTIEVDPDYDLDFATFEAFQKAGGVIGYHCNAFDRSGANAERAIELFHDDVKELRKHIDIKFFSMHGGHVTQDGRCNANLDVEPYLEQLGLTWVHNGHSVYFNSNWADGSASNPRYRKESNDPLDFILSTHAGQRTRLLFHPQYYNDHSNTHFEFPILEDQRWVQATRQTVEAGGFDGQVYWTRRSEEERRSFDTFRELFEAPPDERPVFINGMSRSGTTLLVSLFDAHPDGAMAYESYPRYLHVPSDGGTLSVEEYIYTCQVLMNYPDNVAFQLLNRPPLRNLMRFAAVSSWTGMTLRQTGELLRSYLVDNHRVADVVEALKIVAASARFKQRSSGAQFWGTKCQGNFADYFTLWPKARLIYIMRNGLDVLASQKTNGSFNPEALALGRQWREQHERFHRFRSSHPELCMVMVNYEQLVADPEAVMRRVCEEIGLAFHPQMVRQHELETTLTRNPRGQLAVKRVQQPIDMSSIGKWKTIVSKADVAAFMTGCGGSELFRKYGLDWEL